MDNIYHYVSQRALRRNMGISYNWENMDRPFNQLSPIYQNTIKKFILGMFMAEKACYAYDNVMILRILKQNGVNLVKFYDLCGFDKSFSPNLNYYINKEGVTNKLHLGIIRLMNIAYEYVNG